MPDRSRRSFGDIARAYRAAWREDDRALRQFHPTALRRARGMMQARSRQRQMEREYRRPLRCLEQAIRRAEA